ncbi:MAG: FAD-binding protein [Streptosporangiales bacterium]|nr:FAD-binding protein [Streptosporangiales bacterium]
MTRAVAAEGAGEVIALMDATPSRIKARAAGRPTRTVDVHRPRSFDELVSVVKALAAARRSYTVVGARSNVVGALDTDADVALSTELLTGVLALDPVSQQVRVGAGMLGGALESRLAEQGFTLGQYPQSLHLSTVGGWVGTRACGSSSAMYGGVERSIIGARIVVPSGEVLEFGPRVRPAGGLDGLAAFVGSEGSLGVVGEVTLRVYRRLPERVVCFSFADLGALITAQRELVQGGYPVAMLRGHNLAESAHILGDRSVGGCLLIATTVGPASLVDAQCAAIVERLRELDGVRLPDDAASRWFEERYAVDSMMEDRNRAVGRAFDTVEASVPWSSAPACARELDETFSGSADRYFLHLSHAYETGVCFYSLLWLSDEAGDSAVLARLRDAWDLVLRSVERHGGTVGHHHGIGAVRADWYRGSDDARVHRSLKDAWDPDGLLRARLLAGEGRSAHPDLGVQLG